MITRPMDWNEVKEPSERQKLDITAAVCKVKQAVIKPSDWGDQLCLLFEIVDGEYAGWYQEDFNMQQPKPGEEKKWKGVIRLFLPKNDGSEKDGWTKSTLKGMATSFEKSNPGYQWNWDEKSLVGKFIGILYRNEEWDYNGSTGWSKRPYRCISVESVRECTFKVPKDKPLKKDTTPGYPAPSYGGNYGGYGDYSGNQGYAGEFAKLDDDDSELPFD